ncbi:hypothetical protein FAIPA1_640009 [Frankia sp. AiPs1]
MLPAPSTPSRALAVPAPPPTAQPALAAIVMTLAGNLPRRRNRYGAGVACEAVVRPAVARSIAAPPVAALAALAAVAPLPGRSAAPPGRSA